MPGGEGKRDSEDGFIVSIGRRITDSIGWTAAAEGSKLGQDRMKSRERYRQAKQIDTALGRVARIGRKKIRHGWAHVHVMYMYAIIK